MKRFLRYATLFMMSLVCAGSVWANSITDHVAVAPNNKGDVLIYPWYAALSGGWQTKLTVINTDTTRCVVAKVVVRSMAKSQELIDFLLYLSPADVWTGTLEYDATKSNVVIYSDDESSPSAIAPTVVWPTPATSTTPAVNPIDQPLLVPTVSGDSNGIGYVEVITAASSNDTSLKPGVSKVNIYNGYKALTTGTALPTGAIQMYYANNAVFAPTSYPNVLAGYMEFQNTTVNLSTSLRATALKNYRNTAALTTSVETRLAAKANNNLAEVEAALSKEDVAMPYMTGNNVALHFFTFPTKLTPVTNTTYGAPQGPYFGQFTPAPYCVPYLTTTYDLTEQSPSTGTPFSGNYGTGSSFCGEVNLLSSASFQYAEGWAHYYFNDQSVTTTDLANDSLTYKTPVIPTYLYLGSMGLAANYGAWTDSLVTTSVTPTTLNGYHYTRSYTVTSGVY